VIVGKDRDAAVRKAEEYRWLSSPEGHLARWVRDTDLGGFNLRQIVTPGTAEDFVTRVVPELRRRGLYRTKYEERTLRERFFGAGSVRPRTTTLTVDVLVLGGGAAGTWAALSAAEAGASVVLAARGTAAAAGRRRPVATTFSISRPVPSANARSARGRSPAVG
jgi:hypothetical protein